MIELDDLPELVSPVMIAAFEGWNDAGEAASSVIEHLAHIWDAEPVAAFDPEDYYDFQVNRPRMLFDEGERRLSWRTTRILLARPASIGRDVLLVHGVEPSFRWRAFCVELMEYAQAADVELLVTLGALMADVAHTRPVPVTSTSEQEPVRRRFGVEQSTYEGPTGIVGVVSDAAGQVELPALSLWAAVPHYAGHTPSPKAAVALVTALERVLDSPIDHADLDDDARAWERGVDELASGDPEIADYVEALESAQDTASLPEATGDAIAEQFERYLRRRAADEG